MEFIEISNIARLFSIIILFCAILIMFTDMRESRSIHRLGEPTFRRSICPIVAKLHFISYFAASPVVEAAKLNFPETECRKICVIFTGTTKGRGLDAVPGQEAVLWRIQVSQVQA